jgi:hypothetical protein
MRFAEKRCRLLVVFVNYMEQSADEQDVIVRINDAIVLDCDPSISWIASREKYDFLCRGKIFNMAQTKKPIRDDRRARHVTLPVVRRSG